MSDTSIHTDPSSILVAAITNAAEPTLIATVNAEGQRLITWSNRTFSEAARVAQHELVGAQLSEFLWGADQLPLSELRSTEFPITAQGRDGSTTAWDAAAIPTYSSDSNYWVLTLRPPAGRDLDELLRASEERFRALAERAPIGIFSSEVGLRLSYVNDRLAELVGVPAEQLLGTAWLDSVHDDDLEGVTTGLQDTLAGQPLDLPCRLNTSSGGLRWVNLRAISVHVPGKPATFLGTVEDVTEQRQFEELLAWQATHDPLTRLPNRAELTSNISDAIVAAPDTTAVLFFDLDGFKAVNDTLGHAAGDALLIAVADRLRDTIRPSDIVFRLAGDEFVVLARDVHDDAEAVAVAERLRKCVTVPVTIGEHEAKVGCSVGVVRASASASADEMIRDADVAMYEAKRGGKGRTVMLDDHGRQVREARIQMVDDLRRAMSTDEIFVQYQPIVDAASNRAVGIEALARWQHPILGEVTAGEFVPLACKSGLVTELGQQVLSQACQAFASWQAAGIAPDYLSVNLSASELLTPGFVGSMSQTVLAGGMASRQVCFEISDRDLVAEPERIIPLLDDITRLGFRVSLDDFGTSFASLVHLPRLSLDTLKIDGQLVRQAIEKPAVRALISATVSLCNELSIPTVAEGVETPEERQLAVDLGIHAVQGRGIAPVAGLHDSTRWLGEGG